MGRAGVRGKNRAPRRPDPISAPPLHPGFLPQGEGIGILRLAQVGRRP
jgi:hypothetical protein